MQSSIGTQMRHNIPSLVKVFCYICFLPSLASQLHQSSKTFHLVEKSPQGTVVVNDLRQILGLVSGNDGSSLLAISNAALPGASSFKIDQTRGGLVVQTPPDRDALCPTNPRGSIDLASVGGVSDRREIYLDNEPANQHPNVLHRPCVIQLSIVYGSPSEPSFDILTIILDDINDHAPKFMDEEEHVIRVLETPSGSHPSSHQYGSKINHKKIRIPLPEAVDSDAPENGIRHYRLEGEDAYLFYLEIGHGGDGEIATEVDPRHLSPTSEKRLWLIPSRMSGEAPSGLDYEQRREYRFVLVAVDGGMPPRSGRLPVRLIIEDVNDHVPTFSQTQYMGVMSEDDPPGHVVLQLQASDADGKYENHRINFRIPGNEGQSSNLPYSEAQAAAANLFDIEIVSPYDYGSDLSTDHWRNFTTGQLIVQRKPEKQLRQAAKRALEAAKKLQVSSLDIPHSRLRFRPLDIPSYQLRFVVEAYDFGTPSLSSQVPVFVKIVDVNDDAPEIFVDYITTAPRRQSGKSSCGTLLEGQGRSMIAQVTVVDSDATSITTEVVCSLNDSRFSLEPISTMGNSDWSNMGTNGPSIKSGPSMLMYKLMSTGPLDREGTGGSLVAVLISCTDNQDVETESKRLTSRVELCVNIEDINDNPPQFSSSVYTFKVPENLPPSNRSYQPPYATSGYFIGKVLATDRDTGLNAKIEYSLSSNAKGLIDVDPENGSLYLINPFDREKTKQFIFTVFAMDQTPGNKTGDVRLSSSAEVRIVVTDINDCHPEFESTNYNFEVEENVELAEVGRVKATDADTGDFGRVRYRLAANELQFPDDASLIKKNNADALILSLFQIDPRLGIIRLRGHLDREKKVHYEFIVLAMDNIPLSGEVPPSQSAVRFTATATVLVMVLDQNDNPPQILSPRNLAEFMLSPDQMIAGTTIFTIEAVDSDQGENATVEYELLTPEAVSDNTSDLSVPWVAKNFPFAIDRTAGICYLKQNLPPLNANGANLYTFQVKAYDLGTPTSLNSTVTVRILRGTKSLSGSYTDPLLMHNRYGIEVASKGAGGANVYPGSDWMGEWNGDMSGIPNKTMAIIIAAVFAVVILLAILVFVYFRHQKSFNARMLVNGVLGSPQEIKGPESYIAGNKALRLDSANDAASRKPVFTEVVPAPWVNSSSAVHSPVAFAYPVSPHLMQQRQQQVYLRSPAGNPHTSPGQGVKSATLKSPNRFAQIAPTPTFTPSAVVFRNYRVTGGDMGYQTATVPRPPETFQPVDNQYAGGVGGVCVSSNNSSLLSKTSGLIDTSDCKSGCLIRMNETAKANCARGRQNSSECSDPMPQENSPSSYQRLTHENAPTPTASPYVLRLQNDSSPLRLPSRQLADNPQKREFYPPPAAGNRPTFVTPPRNRHATSARPAFRSLSIDSNLDAFSSSDYLFTAASPKQGRALHLKALPPPLAAPDKRMNFITSAKALSPEIRGSFV